MANSPSHKFGQIIGELLEAMFQAPLTAIARKHGLYLDYKHSRPRAGGKVKVTWADKVEYAAFIDSLEVSLTRRLLRISIAALHGSTIEVVTVADAIDFIEKYDENQTVDGFVRYEVNVRYSNGDKITGEFEDKSTAVVFLRGIR